MGTFFKELWTDPAKFRAVIRGVVVVVAQLILAGVLDGSRIGMSATQLSALAAVLTGGALMVPAGQTNKEVQQEVKKELADGPKSF